MGNSACFSIKNKTISIKDCFIQKSQIVYKSIDIKIDIENSLDYLRFLKAIDFNFCKQFKIGPYFLCDIPILFNNQYKKNTTLILKGLLKMIKYTQYNEIDYKVLFTSENILFFSRIKDKKIKEFIQDCPSMAFSVPLYCVLLSSIPNSFFTNERGTLFDKKNAVKKQIELDIPRTSFKYEVMKEKQFNTNFRSLLYELACRDEDLAYVQGMNFIAAFILMFTGNQLELSLLFFMKILNLQSKIFNMPFRNVFADNFILLQYYLTQFKDMMCRYEYDIYKKLEEIDNDYFFWVSKWIQTLFVLNFKFEFAMKFWDIILSEGLDSILVISLSIVKFIENDILQIHYIEELFLVLEKINNFSSEECVALFSLIERNVKENKYPI